MQGEGIYDKQDRSQEWGAIQQYNPNHNRTS